jgi:hypothetical protein
MFCAQLDLQALTVGAAVLAMRAWLLASKDRVARDEAQLLNNNRKLAIVNGMSEQSRGQSNSSMVKTVVANSLAGCRSPFKCVAQP